MSIQETVTQNPAYSFTELNEMSGAELSIKIVSLPELTCKRCKTFLYPPITIIPDIGNVCGFCQSTNDTQVSNDEMRNLVLEGILRNLVVPCRYTNRGCQNLIDYLDVCEHHYICKYRKYNCPFKLIGDCNWEDNLGNLLNHCLKNHQDSTIKGIVDCFKIDVDISSAKDIIKLLYTGIDKFILHVKCEVEYLQFVLYYIGCNERLSALSYTIEQKRLGALNNKERGSIILHDTKLKCDIAEDHGVNLLMEVANEVLVDSILTITVKIEKKDQNVQLLYKKVLPYFECPVCSSYMKPPIFQCLAGHSICKDCKPRLKQCPTCRGDFGDIRNYSFEALSNDMQFPCSHHEVGCSAVLSVKDITKHEMECSLRLYSCPFSECGWQGMYATIIGHLQDRHKDRITFSNYKAKLGKFNINNQYCLIAHSQIFRISRQYDTACHHIHWSVQLVGPQGYAKGYKYEIGLFDSENNHRRYVRTDICSALTNDDNLFVHCTDIPYSVILQFSDEGKLPHYCRIIKLNSTN